MNYVEIKYNLTSQSAFFIGSGFGITGYIDRIPVKDIDGFVYIPGSSMKGKIRYLCKQLLQLPLFKTSIEICETLKNPEICKTDKPCLICKLFGSTYHEGSLHFHDVKLKEEFRSNIIQNKLNALDVSYFNSLRTNNKINRYTKVSEKGHLFTTEVSEKNLDFEGKITGWLDFVICEASTNQLPLELFLLFSSIRLLTHIGGQKSRGLGSCKIEINYILIDGKECELAKFFHKDVFDEWKLMAEEKEI